jgi:hypothetical protein
MFKRTVTQPQCSTKSKYFLLREGAAKAANGLCSGRIDLFLRFRNSHVVFQLKIFSVLAGALVETNIQHWDFALQLKALRSTAWQLLLKFLVMFLTDVFKISV